MRKFWSIRGIFTVMLVGMLAACTHSRPINLCEDSVPVCPRGPYQAYFAAGTAQIDENAARVLDTLLADHAACPQMRIWLGGYTDRVGGVDQNLALSQRRTQAVADYLMAHGIAQARISTAAFGESDLQVPTADEVREPLNNRVLIEFDRPTIP